jgi:hypothetical protein
MWHMICSTCGGRLFNYDADRMTCKQGHIAKRAPAAAPAPAKRWPWERILVLAALVADALLHLLA